MTTRPVVSEAVSVQLVSMLFDQTATLIAGGLAMAIAAAFCWQRSGEPWFALWACAILVVLVARVILEYAFCHRREPAASIGAWRVRFIVGAWTMGALWGATSLTVVNHDGPLIQMMIITVEMVIIMGAAARNASFPLAARGQAVLGIGPVLVAYLATRDSYYWEEAVFLVFALFGALTLIAQLYERHLMFLRTGEQNLALVDEVCAANRRLEHAATTDSLTGIANRRRFDVALADEVRRAQRDQTELALLFLDIDSFKGFNDLYGHQAGDDCLGRVATVLASSFRRPADLVARYGGEEFAVILPQTDAAAALERAQHIRQNIEALTIANLAGPAGIVSVSIGVTSFAPDRYVRPEDFIRSADEAMYAAKGAGRNCVRVSGERPSCDGTWGSPLCGPRKAHVGAARKSEST